MKSLQYLISIIAFAFLLSACDSGTSTSAVDPQEPNIVDIAAENEDFSILVDALLQTNLAGPLEGNGPFTVFAPTNNAFNALPNGLLDSLSDEQLSEILTYHVLETEVGSAAIQPEQAVVTLNGEELFITAQANTVTLNNSSTVSTADVLASNGIIHIINQVLLPDNYGSVVDNAQKRYFLSTLVDLVVELNLAETLADPDASFTVFAPTNEAFAEIAGDTENLSPEELTDILLYHVLDTRVLSTDLQGEQTVTTLSGDDITVILNDGVVTINGNSIVTSADNNGTNGVIHVIDTVLLPPTSEDTAADGSLMLNHVGASAWIIESIEGNGISAELDVENTDIILEPGLRYEFTNLGTGNHPFELRDLSGDVLIAEAGNGSLQDYEPAKVVIDEANGIITFTLTGDLADRVATYNCAPHASMEGDIIVGVPVL